MFPLWAFLAKAEGLYDSDQPRIWHLTTDEGRRSSTGSRCRWPASLFFIRALPDETITVQSARRLLRRGAGGRLHPPPARARYLAQARAARARPRARPGKLADAVARKLALEPGHHLSVLEYAGLEHTVQRQGRRPEPSDLKLEELSKEDLEFLFDETRRRARRARHAELDETTLARVVSPAARPA